MFKGNAKFYRRCKIPVFPVSVELSLKYFLDSFDPMTQHFDKIFNSLLFRRLKVQGKDGHFKLLICVGLVNEDFPDIFYQFFKSCMIADSGQHREKFKLNRLTESVYFDAVVILERDDDFLLTVFILGMDNIV